MIPVRRVSGLIALCLVLLVPTSPGAAADGPGGPSPPGGPVLEDAVDWVLDRRDENGCIAGSGGQTAWAVQLAASAGRDPGAGDPSLVDGLKACSPRPDQARNAPNAIARYVMALVAAGEDPRAFNDTDWVERLRSYYEGTQFRDEDSREALNDDVFAILALRAAGVPQDDQQIQGAATFLSSNQKGDGGWGIAASGSLGSSTTGMTGAVLEALTAAGTLAPGDASTQSALAYLAQRAAAGKGCFGYSADYPSADVEATAWAILGLLTVREDPRADRWSGQASPWDCLREHQMPDGGFRTESGDASDAMATRKLTLALAAIPHGRATPDQARPPLTLYTTSTPREGEETTLAADGVAHATWQLPDGTLLEGTRADWTPTEPGDVEIDVLVLSADGVASTGPFATTVQSAEADETGQEPEDDGEGTDQSETNDGDQTPDDAGDEDATPPSIRLPNPLDAERNVALEVHVNTTPEDEPVVELRVAWGDGNRTDWQASNRFDHAYATLGEYTLTAWARDADGDVAEATATVNVEDAKPRVWIQVPRQAPHGRPVPVNATASDPDGPTPQVTWTLANRSATGLETTLEPPTPGEHLVRAIATDGAGNEVAAEATLTAFNQPPTNLTVQPRAIPANQTTVLRADAMDPNGDPIALAWTRPGDEDASTWGGQLHLEAGPPGNLTVAVNATDPHGGWALATVALRVVDEPGQAPVPPVAIETSQRSTKPSPLRPAANVSPQRPTVQLPDRLTIPSNATHPLAFTSNDPDGSVRRVEVQLGGLLPVRGTTNATALLPALPPGNYTVTAHAIDQAGNHGPTQHLALTVEPASRDLSPTSHVPAPTPNTTPLPLGLALTALLAAAGARRR